jgi:rod shape determining protein RodA
MMFSPQPRPFAESEELGEVRRLGKLDWVLLGGALGLIVISLITLGVGTRDDIPGSPNYYVYRQAVYGVIGILIVLALSRIDYSRFRELRVGLYAAMITSIGLVFVVGSATRGSHRWIELPFFRFQPSELGKVLLIVSLAGFVIDQTRRATERERTARALLLGLIPALIVFSQPDLGTGAAFGVITLAILFVAGVRWSHFAALAGLAVAATALVLVVAPALHVPVLKGYQAERLTAFVHPSEDPRDAGYQVNQALIAVGSGHKTGRGSEATQTRLDFLPEHHTDFIFAVVGERFGFVGAAIVLSLYALLIWRALRILTLAKNFYGALLAGGIVAMLMFQVFVNVGMSLGIMPITGIPLPLLSYGGSSVLVTFAAIGLLQSIYVQARLSSKSREIMF